MLWSFECSAYNYVVHLEPYVFADVYPAIFLLGIRFIAVCSLLPS